MPTSQRPEIDPSCTIDFCRACAVPLLAQWKGWPHRDPIPAIPIMDGGACRQCMGREVLLSTQIAWLNVHGAYSTGLPDYWQLVTAAGGGNDVKRLIAHWGHPYYRKLACPGCHGQCVSSVHLGHTRLTCPSCGFDRETT